MLTAPEIPPSWLHARLGRGNHKHTSNPRHNNLRRRHVEGHVETVSFFPLPVLHCIITRLPLEGWLVPQWPGRSQNRATPKGLHDPQETSDLPFLVCALYVFQTSLRCVATFRKWKETLPAEKANTLPHSRDGL